MFNLSQGREIVVLSTLFLFLRNNDRHQPHIMFFRYYNCQFLTQEVEELPSSGVSMPFSMRRYLRKMMHGKFEHFVACVILGSTFVVRDCPQCKAKRRASKKLSLARLPPVLMVHFKRFEANGRFSDKIDTFVDFPMKSLDLTNYMPPPLPPGADRSQLNGGLPIPLEDPRSQLPPYRYDLYGVTNHYGNLSSGHCESWIILIWIPCLLFKP